MNSLIATVFLFSSIVGFIWCISIPVENYPSLILNRCFNETSVRNPSLSGPIDPYDLSIENLILKIEKIEKRMPYLNAKQIYVLLLKRFEFLFCFFANNHFN
jgi:hypothetical protein